MDLNLFSNEIDRLLDGKSADTSDFNQLVQRVERAKQLLAFKADLEHNVERFRDRGDEIVFGQITFQDNTGQTVCRLGASTDAAEDDDDTRRLGVMKVVFLKIVEHELAQIRIELKRLNVGL